MLIRNKLIRNNKVLTVHSKWLNHTYDPYNPLNLPPFTIRVKYKQGTRPGYNPILVDEVNNIWDITWSYSSDWSSFFEWDTNLVEVIGANTTGVTNMSSMFEYTGITSVPLFDTSSVTNMSSMFDGCANLTSIPLFDTSNVTDMSHMLSMCSSLTSIPLLDTSNVTTMFGMCTLCISLTSVPLFDTSNVTDMSHILNWCERLTTIPLFNTSKVTDMSYAFEWCRKVESGALALYQQASTQSTPPQYHVRTFNNCGSNTTTGAAELAQIPSDWK